MHHGTTVSHQPLPRRFEWHTRSRDTRGNTSYCAPRRVYVSTHVARPRRSLLSSTHDRVSVLKRQGRCWLVTTFCSESKAHLYISGSSDSKWLISTSVFVKLSNLQRKKLANGSSTSIFSYIAYKNFQKPNFLQYKFNSVNWKLCLVLSREQGYASFKPLAMFKLILYMK